jgi:hypothetical protein
MLRRGSWFCTFPMVRDHTGSGPSLLVYISQGEENIHSLPA